MPAGQPVLCPLALIGRFGLLLGPPSPSCALGQGHSSLLNFMLCALKGSGWNSDSVPLSMLLYLDVNLLKIKTCGLDSCLIFFRKRL